MNKIIKLLEPEHTKYISMHIDYLERYLVPLSKGKDEWSGMKSAYGDPVAEALLFYCKPKIEEQIGKQLRPTYSFWRTYFEGQPLKKHKDRPSCEISVTLCIDMADDADPWDIFVDAKPFKLQRGEGVVYRGCDQEHWREPLKYDWHRQIFLHYIDKNGEFYPKYEFDRRATLYSHLVKDEE